MSVDDEGQQSEHKVGDRNLCEDWNDTAENWVQNEMVKDHKIENWVQNELTDGHKKLQQENWAQKLDPEQDDGLSTKFVT